MHHLLKFPVSDLVSMEMWAELKPAISSTLMDRDSTLAVRPHSHSVIPPFQETLTFLFFRSLENVFLPLFVTGSVKFKNLNYFEYEHM